VPQVKIQGGVSLEIPNRDEIREDIGSVWQQQQRQHIRGIKWMRLPETLSGPVVSSAIQLGVAKGQVVGPEQGYAWSLGRLLVSGLTAGTTPDIVNLYRNDRFAGPPLWQFNGNNFGYTFGKLRLVLMSGDTLSLQNVGTIAATGTILLSGELIEVPAERLGELA
jgi:hypothetical protein